MAERETRRELLRRGATVAGVAGAAWVAPQLVSRDAAMAAASDCTGTQGFFTWNRAAYTTGQRSGAPGGANQMDTVSGWTGHPTYTTLGGATTTPVTITYRMENTTFLNTGAAPDGGQGHGVSSANNSATFKSYRVSKIGTTGSGPPAGNILTVVIVFSQLVGCPAIEIGDNDNNLPTSTTCTAPVAGAAPYWADGLTAVGYTLPGAGGSTVATTRIAGTGGTNITPAVGAAGPWSAIACQSIPQNSSASNLTIQAVSAVRELRLQYTSNFQDTTGTGAQHIALGNISFYY